jgi:hypothetical protein
MAADFTLALASEEREALITALDNYLDGHGMADRDEDEPLLDRLLSVLANGDGSE